MGYIRNSHYRPIVSLLNKSHSPYLTKELHPLVCIQQTEKKYFANIRLLIVDENQTKKAVKLQSSNRKTRKRIKKVLCDCKKKKILMQFPSRSLYAPSIVVSKLIIIMQF